MTDAPSDDKLPEVTPTHAQRAKWGFLFFAGASAALLAGGYVVVSMKKAAGAAALAAETEKFANAPPLVEVVPVEATPPTHKLTLPGSVAAWNSSTIYARVDGFVATWSADLGDQVKKGQVLAVLETPDVDSRLVAAKAKLRADEGVVTERKSQADFARTTFKRWSESPKGVVSDQERESKKADNDNAIAKLHEAEAQLGLDQADVDRFTVLANFKNVVAPYDGTITERHIDIGNLVTAGSTASTTPLYRIQQDAPVRVFVDVPQSMAANINAETQADIRSKDILNRSFAGKVTRTANHIEAKARTLKVEIDLPNEDHALVPGMYVDVNFSLATKGLLQVPAAALVFRSAGAAVAVVDSKNRVSFHPVTIAQDHGSLVELSSGVSPGDKVALNINSEVVDGDVVEIHASDAASTKVPQAATH